MTDNRSMGRPMGPPKTVRELRLWHWRKVRTARTNAEGFEEAYKQWEEHRPGKVCKVYRNRARDQHKIANWHLAAVQVLNDHFDVPNGDTADRDNGYA